MWREKMVRDSVELLKVHNEAKVLNLGGFRIKLESPEEKFLAIESLEYALRNCTDQKLNQKKEVMHYADRKCMGIHRN